MVYESKIVQKIVSKNKASKSVGLLRKVSEGPCSPLRTCTTAQWCRYLGILAKQEFAKTKSCLFGGADCVHPTHTTGLRRYPRNRSSCIIIPSLSKTDCKVARFSLGMQEQRPITLQTMAQILQDRNKKILHCPIAEHLVAAVVRARLHDCTRSNGDFRRDCCRTSDPSLYNRSCPSHSHRLHT